jgi:thymidylate synthase (FAD)
VKATLIACTQTCGGLFDTPFTVDVNTHSADRLAEFAGRSCYQSWSNPSGRNNQEYIGNIIAQGHFSVLEHASATFYIEGVSRALTHELIRHRHLSYSQLSQRFVDESNAELVVPPALSDCLDDDIRPEWEYGFSVKALLNEDVWETALFAYKELVAHLQGKGLTRKQAREAARAVLPNMTETKIVVTGNHRAWREFLAKRNNEHADAEIQELAKELLRQLRPIAPAIYQDME